MCNSSDPFGLCPPDDAVTGPQCVVVFAGVSLNAVIGGGFTLGFGRYWTGEGSGWYFRFGAGAGLNVSAGAEGGVSDSRASLGGDSQGYCVTIAVGGMCHTTNASGATTSGSVGPSAFIVGAHAEETSTEVSKPKPANKPDSCTPTKEKQCEQKSP